MAEMNPKTSTRTFAGYSEDQISKLLKGLMTKQEKREEITQNYMKTLTQLQQDLGDKHEELMKLQEKHQKEQIELDKKFNGRTTGMVGAAGNLGKLGMKGLLAGIPAGQMFLLGQQLFNEIYPKADRDANKLERKQRKLDEKQRKELSVLQKKEIAIKKKQLQDSIAEQRSKISAIRNQPQTKGDEMIRDTLVNEVSEPLKDVLANEKKLLEAQEQELASTVAQEEKMLQDEKDAKKENSKGTRFVKAVKEQGKSLLTGLLPVLLLILPSLIVAVVDAVAGFFGFGEKKFASAEDVRTAENTRRDIASGKKVSKEAKKQLEKVQDTNARAVGDKFNSGNYTQQDVLDNWLTSNEMSDPNNPITASHIEAYKRTGDLASFPQTPGYKLDKFAADNIVTKWDNASNSKLRKAQNVQDVIITKDGKIIQTAPDDNIMATKNSMIGDSTPAMRKERERKQKEEMETTKATKELVSAITKQNTTVEKQNGAFAKGEYRVRDYSPVSEALKYIYITGN